MKPTPTLARLVAAVLAAALGAACSSATSSLPSSAGIAPPAAASRSSERIDSPYSLHDALGRPIPRTHVMLTREAAGLIRPDTVSNVSYHGGPVELVPNIHLIFWGFGSASADPNGEAAYLKRFVADVAGSKWLGTVTQYYSNPGKNHISDPQNQLKGTWYDNSSVPAKPTQAQVADEAAKAAAHFNWNTEGASYFIVLPAKHDPSGFGNVANGFCAFHSAVTKSGHTVVYDDFPYQTDAGGSCGENSRNPGNAGVLDGVSIVAGHEIAEAQTDPRANAWYDGAGNEIGDKCAWTDIQNTKLLSGDVYATQPLWSNATAGCTQAEAGTALQTKLGSGFSSPAGVAVRAACEVSCYVAVADTENGDIKQISPDGKTVGLIDSNLSQPYGVAIQQDTCATYCDTYIADTRASSVLEINASGQTLPVSNGFFDPFGVAVGQNGTVYVADTDDSVVDAVVVSSSGTAVLPIGSGFASPQGVAVDGNGNVYVADTGNNAIKEVAAGSSAVTIVGHGFFGPTGVAVDPFCTSNCNVYVADTLNNAVKIVAPNGTVTTIGSGFSQPQGVAVDGAGNIFVADTGNNAVWEIAP